MIDIQSSYVDFEEVTFKIDEYNTDNEYEYHAIYVHGNEARVIINNCVF